MRRDVASVHEAGRVEQERTRAHARHPGAVGGHFLDPVERARDVGVRAGTFATGHDEHIEGWRVVEAVVGYHPEPLRGAHRLGALGDRDHSVAFGTGHREHLPRAGEVELFGVVEQEHSGRDRHQAISLSGRKRCR